VLAGGTVDPIFHEQLALTIGGGKSVKRKTTRLFYFGLLVPHLGFHQDGANYCIEIERKDEESPIPSILRRTLVRHSASMPHLMAPAFSSGMA
jgi:hypothetical protein